MFEESATKTGVIRYGTLITPAVYHSWARRPYVYQYAGKTGRAGDHEIDAFTETHPCVPIELMDDAEAWVRDSGDNDEAAQLLHEIVTTTRGLQRTLTPAPPHPGYYTGSIEDVELAVVIDEEGADDALEYMNCRTRNLPADSVFKRDYERVDELWAELEKLWAGIRERAQEVLAAQKTPDHYRTVTEAAEFLNVEPSTVRRYIHDGRLPAIQLGKPYRVAISELKQLKRELDEEKEPSW